MTRDRNSNGTFKKDHAPIYADPRLLSKLAIERLSHLSPEEQLQRLKNSALSVPRWNKGKHYTRPEVIKRIMFPCVICKTPFEKIPSSKKITCSSLCLRELQKKNSSNMPEEVRLRIGESVKRLYKNPVYRERFILGRKKMISNETWRHNVLRRRCPTKPEKKMGEILNGLFPMEYKFVGDGQIWIGNKNPDFININGQKKLIEVWGDYWHRHDIPDNLINNYLRYGFKTLIIWEHELNENLPSVELMSKLRDFHAI